MPRATDLDLTAPDLSSDRFGSSEYARRVGARLKDRIFLTVFPCLAQGFLEDRKHRLGELKQPTEQELADVFEATQTLLYRLLFLLHAEGRDLLPVQEAPYRAVSLQRLVHEIADRAGGNGSEAAERLNEAYSARDTTLCDRLGELFHVLETGDPNLNVPPCLEGGRQENEGGRRKDCSSFLLRGPSAFQDCRIPDCYLARAIDGLARDQDERSQALDFLDYQTLEVRHLGAIYEGLLRFKLQVASEDLMIQVSRKGLRYVPLSRADVKPARQAQGRKPRVVVAKGDVYLSSDRADRKASGSYYTPDPIVKYVVAQTIGPVLDKKLQAYDARKDGVDRLFDLRVLDPAMGSGHFLVEAVDFITHRLIRFLNQFTINPVRSLLDQTRRQILRSLSEEHGIDILGPVEEVVKDRNNPWTARLTDINLLKRHVLAHCIHGVDLDPRAVELTKVSLWLHARMVGAPLTFLDHHLRCGNALIGATFDDLEEATNGERFGLNCEPLPHALRHDLLSRKQAETAASASCRNQASQHLAPYRLMLDALVAQHSGLRPDRRFFHWEVEFPEVFFGFIGGDERQVAHKDRIQEGSAGFDCVLGNPPWGQKQVAPDDQVKRYAWKVYPSSQGIFDLFRPFVERGTRLLRTGGSLGMVLPDVLLLKDYVPSRRYLLGSLTIRAIDWWGMAFADAVIDSVSIVGIRQSAANGHMVRVCVHDPECPLTQEVPQAEFAANPRSVFNLFLTPEKRRALGKLEANPKLGDWFEVHEGVHSGNIRKELFVDGNVDRTCRELYFGRDEIVPYHLRWQGRHIRLGVLPAPRTRQRYANAGRPEWHERQKLLVRRTGDFVLAALDEAGRYASNNFFIVFPARPAALDLHGLAALLNSQFMTSYFRTIEPRRGRVFAELKIKHLSVFPLPPGIDDGTSCAEMNDLGRRRTRLAARLAHDSSEGSAGQAAFLDAQIEECVRRLYGFSNGSPFEEEKP